MAKEEKTADAAPLEAADLSISAEHREYVLQRHGTLQLDPIPSADPADPLNWPGWKVDAPGVYRGDGRIC